MSEYINNELIENTYLFCIKRVANSDMAKDLAHDILLEDWEAARCTPPEYIPQLIEYQLKYEEIMRTRVGK